MFIPLKQFIQKEAIKGSIYLLNPIIVDIQTLKLPRLSVIHYLDLSSNVHFPTKDLIYFKDIPNSKKIPIYHVTDLKSKNEVTSLQNKLVTQEFKNWSRENIAKFKHVDLLERPNKDLNTVSIINYNLLKDLYNYKESLLTPYHKYNNLYSTYWYYVKQSIKADKESVQYVKIDLPSIIPSYKILEVFNKLKTERLYRTISNYNILNILDIYRWLSNKTRNKSTMNVIDDNDSLNIIVEIAYKGYSVFLPLYILRSLSKESELKNSNKLSDDKVQKLFITFLFRIQKKIESLVNKEDIPHLENDEEKEEKEKSLLELSNDDEEFDNDEEGIEENKNNIYNELNTSNKKEDLKNIIDEDEVFKEKDLASLIEDIDINEDLTLSDQVYQDELISNKNDRVNESPQPLNVPTDDTFKTSLLKDSNLTDKVDSYLNVVTDLKTISSAEIRSIKKLIEKRKELKSPYDSKIELDKFKKISKDDLELTEEDVKLDINNNLVDDSLKKEIISILDKKYIKNAMHKDIVACISDIEKNGIIIKDYTVTEETSILGRYETHKLVIKPLNGKESTIYFRLPKIDSEGNFYASGVKLVMRRQRTDLPIRKISPTKVALTSNYGKLFVFRTERKAFDPNRYIVETVKNLYLEEGSIVTNIKPGNSYNNLRKLPNVYSYFSQHFNEIVTTEYTLIFNYDSINEYIDGKVYKDLNDKNLVFIGYNKNKEIIVMDINSNIFNYSKNNELIGTIDELFDLDKSKLPKPFTMLKVLGDNIPLGPILSYYIGFSNLIGILGASYELLGVRERYTPLNHEVVLRFKNYKLVVKTNNIQSRLLLNGFLFYKNIIKDFDIEEFDKKEVYLDLLESRNSSLRHLKELNLLRDLFLDSITIDVLESMNEPINFLELLLRANELLKDFTHPDINDPNYSRIRGLDRIPGLVYRAITESIRTKELTNKDKIELDPYKVWTYVTGDNSVKIVEDNNPITNLKEKEVVTFSGIDGINKSSTPVGLRRYHENDIGLISEATVDSGDVALNTYLTPFAKFKDIRGLVKDEEKEFEEHPANIFSTSVLLAPDSEHDDVKRINFVSIQNGHTISSKGYHQPIIRTEYEYIVPYRVGSLYANSADLDGKVIDKTDKLLTVQYEDNTIKTYPVGYRYGKMEGSVYPHLLVTDLNKGDKFKKNDFLTYNSGFFERDWLDKNNLILKFSKNVKVALTMTNEVYEDSSAISVDMSKELSSEFIKEKSFIIEFNKNIHKLLPIGTKVEPNDFLFTLTDETIDEGNLKESTIELLQSLANISPKAKVNGTIVKYEVRYNGDKQDMSPTLKKLVTKTDRELYEETKGTEYEVSNGKVSFEYRVDGKNLQLDTLELKVFILVEISQAIGDKGVFANQMKTVLSDVYTETILTESGEKVDGLFSYKGILNRIVNSPILIGTTNRLVLHVSKQAADIYFNKN